MGFPILWSHETRLPAEADSPSKARAFVALHLAEHELPQLTDDVRLVVSELATNAAVHARTPFTVMISAADHRVLLTVQDDSTRMPLRIPAGALDLGGRGLTIVALVSSEWGVARERGGAKSVWAAFDIHVPSPVAPEPQAG